MGINVVGLDISIQATGAARIRIDNDGQVVGQPFVRHFGEGAPSDPTLPVVIARLRRQAARILKFVQEGAEPGDTTVVAVETVNFASSTAHAHTGGGLWYLAMHYVLRETPHIAGVNVQTLKRYATGSGGGDKTAVIAAVARMFPGQDITNNNDADAAVLLAMTCRELGHPLEPSVQKVTPAALEVVRWPEFVQAYRAARH